MTAPYSLPVKCTSRAHFLLVHTGLIFLISMPARLWILWIILFTRIPYGAEPGR